MAFLSTKNLFQVTLKKNLNTKRKKTRKRFSEKPIVAFTNSTVFILDFYIYDLG